MIPKNITKEHIENGFEHFEKVGLPDFHAKSVYYDVLRDGKVYPPKVIVSYANIFSNGEELDRNTFNPKEASKVLRDNGYEVINKNNHIKYDSGVLTKSLAISKAIVDNGLAKLSIRKNTKEHTVYYSQVKPLTDDFKIIYGKSPNLILSEILKKLFVENEFSTNYEVKNFKYWGRILQPYVWACISLKDSQNRGNPASYSPQIYIAIDDDIVRFGLCYGNYLHDSDETVVQVKNDDSLIEEMYDILYNTQHLGYFFVPNEGILKVSRDTVPINSKDDLCENWSVNSHVYGYIAPEDIDEDSMDEIAQILNSLIPVYKKICGYSSTTNIEEVAAKSTDTKKTYWLYAPGANASHWDEFYDNGIMAIGWNGLPDLKDYSREDIVSGLKAHQPERDSDFKNDSLCCYEFAHKIQIGDVVICKKGRKEYLGYGIVQGEYYYDSDVDDYRHRRKVNWVDKGFWEETKGSIALKTLTNISKYPDYVSRLIELLDIEKDASTNGIPTMPAVKYTKEMALQDLFIEAPEFDRIVDLLGAKQNIILQGPPGVGKSFISKRIAYSLLGSKDDSRVEMIQFHQSYSYEDFIQGYRPSDDGNFVLKDGVFYNFCAKARENLNDKYVFIIDEINRGNLSKIFGELMLLIENDKRGPEYSISLTYSDNDGSKFYIPENLYIIGMMNTADRSLAMVDYALRRRFCFIDLSPQFDSKRYKEHLKKHKVNKELIDRIISRMNYLNGQISEDSDLGIGYQIGHSFFTPNKSDKYDENWYNQVVKYEVEPLIKEYWFDSIDKVNSALDALKK